MRRLRRVLDLVLEGEPLTLHVTVPLVLEYEGTLLRERAHFGLGYSDIVVLLAALLEQVHRHEVHYLWRGLSSSATPTMLTSSRRRWWPGVAWSPSTSGTSRGLPSSASAWSDPARCWKS